MSDKIDFLHADMHEILLQIDTVTLIGIVKRSQSFQNSKVTMSLQYIKKKLGRECIFNLQMNIKVFYRLTSTFWASKMPARWYCHYCWVWSSILKVLKVISLQYLYNISKKEVRKGVHVLHADEHQSFYKLGLLFLMGVTRYVQSTQNRKLVIFLQRVLQHFCVLLWCKIFRFTGVQQCLLLLVSSHSQTRNFLPEHLIIIIKQLLCGEGLPSFLPLLQADAFR